MRLIKIILFVLFVCLSPLLFVQTVQIDQFHNITNMADAKVVNSQEQMLVELPVEGLPGERISYSKIKGSPFWKDEWQPALL